MLTDFSVDVIDAITGEAKPKTTIGDKTYAAVETGKEFYIRLSVDNPIKHRKLYPQGNLNGYVDIDGKSIGYSSSFHGAESSVTFKHTGGRALAFTKPEMAWFHDIEDKKKADIEAAKLNSKLGMIEAKFSQIELTGEVVANTSVPIAQSKGAKKKAGGSDMPTVGISAGRDMGLAPATLRKVRTLQTFGSIAVYCKPAKAIKMIKAVHERLPLDDDEEEEEEVEAAPPAAAASSSAAGQAKKRQSIAIDLTKGDSDSDDEEYLQQLAASRKRVKAEATG